MKIDVKILPFMLGTTDRHRVVVVATVDREDGNATISHRAEALRLDAAGQERKIDSCLEEAFAEILKQALTP